MNPYAIIGLLAGLAIAAWGIMFALAAAGVGDSEAAWYAPAGAILLKILDKAFAALRMKRAKRDEDDERGFVVVGLLALLAAVAVGALIVGLSGCPSVWSGRTSRADIQANGDSGLTVTCTVDGSQVCQVNGKRSDLKVDSSTARRMCLQYPKSCSWRTP